MLNEVVSMVGMLAALQAGPSPSPEPIRSPEVFRAPVPTAPPRFSTDPCGTWRQPTDNALLILRRAEVRGADYYLTFIISGFRNDPTFPSGTRGGLLYLRLDDGPTWYVSPNQYPNVFYVTIAGLAKGNHRLVAALASHGGGTGMFVFAPTVVNCFTI